jgi:hypothetical protein
MKFILCAFYFLIHISMSLKQSTLSNILIWPGSQEVLDSHKCQGCRYLLTFTNGSVVMVLGNSNTPIWTFCSFGGEESEEIVWTQHASHMYPINFFSTDTDKNDAYIHCPLEEKIHKEFPREILRGLGGCMAD